MSGLYNTVFGMNAYSDVILATLGLKKEQCGRFRDCWVEKIDNDYRIVVHTRNGGGNREHFIEGEPGNDCSCPGCIITFKLPKHPLYLGDKDDEFDKTYADVYFKLPNEYRNELIAIASDEPVKTSDKWKLLFNSMDEEIIEKNGKKL
jgi:hypothetical protein